jgi:hypothetical protein
LASETAFVCPPVRTSILFFTHTKPNCFLQTSPPPEREAMAYNFPTVNSGSHVSLNSNCMSLFTSTNNTVLTDFRDHGISGYSYPPQGLQITGHNAIGPSGRYHLTRSGSVTATKEITANADPQATTSPSPLVLDSRTMSIVVPRKLGPKSEAEKSASKQLRQAGGACKKHRVGKKRVSPHCPPKIKNYVN